MSRRDRQFRSPDECRDIPQAGEPLAVAEVKGAGAKGDIGADSVISPEVRAEFAVRWNDATDLAALAAWRL